MQDYSVKRRVWALMPPRLNRWLVELGNAGVLKDKSAILVEHKGFATNAVKSGLNGLIVSRLLMYYFALLRTVMSTLERNFINFGCWISFIIDFLIT